MSLRRATPADAEAIGRLHHHTMRTSLPFLPELHTPEDVVDWVGGQLMARNTVWVAEGPEGVVTGYIAFDADWINQLYVHPDQQGRGLGPQLLAKALEDGASRQLWTFQKNARARRFYEAHGFVAVKLTDGSGNEEREPDILYRWSPPA